MSGNKKVERIYNKDRIQRIKEASENAKKSDPNWGNDAPPSIIPNYDDDLPITRTRTPEFLKEVDHNDINPESLMMKKLTINELTQCTKDSSQLMNIMNSSGKPVDPSANIPKPVNYLEMSRMKKVKERDDFNRQTAESLHKASERWHSQLKEYNRNKNTQDSTGVRSSLFADDCSEFEKSETERNEKRTGSRRFSSDFINKLDLLLQKGMRQPKLSRNINNLRDFSERSYSRWANRFDKFSSMWDLRYPLLNHSLGAGPHANNFRSDLSCPGFSPGSKFHSTMNLGTDYNLLYNMPNPYQPTVVQGSSISNQNSYFSNPQFMQNYIPQYSDQFYQKPSIIQSPVEQNHLFNACNTRPQTQGSMYPQTVLWQNQLPFQTTYNTNPMISSYGNHMPFMSPVPLDAQPVLNGANLPNTNSTNDGPSRTFEMVTRKIDLLAEKLDVLNSTVDQMKSLHVRQNCKPIIKTHKHVSISSEIDKPLNGLAAGNPSQQQNMTCCCPDCSETRPSQSVLNDRRVRFVISEDERKINDSSNNDSCQISNDMEDSSNMSLDKLYMELYSKDVHPRMIQQQLQSMSKHFKSFKLPSELSAIKMRNLMNGPI